MSTGAPTTDVMPTALWVVPVSNLAGVARHVIDTARVGLPGWRLVVTTPEGPLLERLRELGTPVIPLPLEFGTRIAVRSLRATVRRLRPQIVHSHLARADFLVAMATTGLSVKLISTEHHISPDRYMFHPNHAEARLMETAHRLRLTRFSRVIAVSASTKHDMLTRWKSRTPITVILNGIDRPDPAPAREPGLRFLSLTRLSAEKNVDMTLRAFALIAAERPEARLTVAGRGPERPRLRILAGRLGIFDSVDFPGFVDPDEAMANHDVILQPSLSDNCSYTLLDAAAHGMGVAASPIGGNPEILPMRCIAALDEDAGFARVAVEQGLDPSARPVLGPQVPTVAQMVGRIVGEYEAALGTEPRAESVASGADPARTDGVASSRPRNDDAADDPPEVSVVIPYFKAADWLPTQLNALAQQVEPPAFEVIIADNEGSTELPSVIVPFRDELDVRIVDATSRRGASYARNQGASASMGRFLAFCDADDVVGPQWVRAIAEALRTNDSLVGGPSRMDRLNEPYQWKTFACSETTRRGTSLLSDMPTHFGYLPFVGSCNMAMRRDSFLTLGGFDETLTLAAEDADLSWRALEYGMPLQQDAAASFDYRLRATPVEILHKLVAYGRGHLALWQQSRHLGRPMSGMSLRWTLAKTAALPLEALQLVSADEAEKYAFAAHAGDLVGNLRGQWDQRVLPQLRSLLPQRRLRTSS